MSGPRMSVTPLIQWMSQKLGRAQSIAEAASETVVICPEEERLLPRALHLDGQLDRVTGVADGSSFDLEKTRLGGVPISDLATMAYRIDDAIFSAGRVFTRRMQDHQGGDQRRKLLAPISVELNNAVLPLNSFATIYFGHMVFDGGAAMLLAPDFGEACVDRVVSAGMAGHVARYFDLFGTPHTAISDARIKSAWLFEDRGMNSHKRARLKTLSARVRTIPGTRAGHGVFIRRRGWGVHRAPENEAQLEEFFAARGFDIIDPREMTVDDIVARTRDAEILIGVEGSGMTHGMISMAQNTLVVMLLPPSRLNNMMKDYADGLGQNYAFVVGTAQQNGGGYLVDPEEILRTIDLVLK